MITVDTERFITTCEDYEVKGNTAYSGRGMMGKRCVAIFGRPNDVATFFLQVLPAIYDGDEIPINAWGDMHWDEWGKGWVFYWPRIQAESVEDRHPVDKAYDESDPN